MKYFSLFAILGLLSLAGSKNRGISVEHIKSGRQLEKAKEATFGFFFENREPRVDKKFGPTASDILLETDSFIYFGHINYGAVGSFYKVRTSEILVKFPLYKTVTPDSVRKIAEAFFYRKYPRAGCSISYVEKAICQDKGILVRFWCKQDSKKNGYITDSILLSKTDLSIIK